MPQSFSAGVIRRMAWLPEKWKHVKAWRRYVRFLFSVGRMNWGMQKVVSTNTIIKYKKIMEGNGLGYLYKLPLGGARLKHILRMAEV